MKKKPVKWANGKICIPYFRCILLLNNHQSTLLGPWRRSWLCYLPCPSHPSRRSPGGKERECRCIRPSGGLTSFMKCLTNPAYEGLDNSNVEFISNQLFKSSTKGYSCSWKKFASFYTDQ